MGRQLAALEGKRHLRDSATESKVLIGKTLKIFALVGYFLACCTSLDSVPAVATPPVSDDAATRGRGRGDEEKFFNKTIGFPPMLPLLPLPPLPY